MTENNLVPEKWACPWCGERRVDYLFCPEDEADPVRCESCGKEYHLDI